MIVEEFFYPFEFFSRNHLTTLLLAGFCAYVGVFVILKRIVFVGIAIAEFSVLGVAASLLAASLVTNGALSEFLDKAGPGPSIGSVVFAFLGILLLTVGAPSTKLSRDGLIGWFYATAAAIALLFVWRSAAGREELEHIVAGSVLFVNPLQLLVLAISYAGVAVVHSLFFKEFLFTSFDREMARTLGLRTGLWDFLLYATIGVVISIGTRIGGVLVVFGFLVIPPIGGLLLADRFGSAVRIAVTQAVIASCAGLYLSYRWAYPTGPMVVAALSALGGVSFLGYRFPILRKAIRWGGAALLVPVAASIAIAVSNFVAGTGFVTQPSHVPEQTPPVEEQDLVEHLVEDLRSPIVEVRRHAVEELARLNDRRAIEGLCYALTDAAPSVRKAAASASASLSAPDAASVVSKMLETGSADERRWIVEGLANARGPHILAEIRKRLSDSDPAVAQAALTSLVDRDDRAAAPEIERMLDTKALPTDVRLQAADALARFGSMRGLSEYLSLLRCPQEPFIRSEAFGRVRPLLDGDSGFDPVREPDQNAEAIRKLESKLAEAKGEIEWDPDRKALRFKPRGS